MTGHTLSTPADQGRNSAATFLAPSVVLVSVLADFYFRYHEIPALQGAVAGLGPVVIALILVQMVPVMFLSDWLEHFLGTAIP